MNTLLCILNETIPTVFAVGELPSPETCSSVTLIGKFSRLAAFAVIYDASEQLSIIALSIT